MPQSKGSARSPGRAKSLHEKLLSPTRKKPTPMESLRSLEERQEAAEKNRERMEHERRERLKLQADRLRQVTERQTRKRAMRQLFIDETIERADQNREAHIQDRVRKAEEELAKVNEIAFISNHRCGTLRA